VNDRSRKTLSPKSVAKRVSVCPRKTLFSDLKWPKNYRCPAKILISGFEVKNDWRTNRRSTIPIRSTTRWPLHILRSAVWKKKCDEQVRSTTSFLRQAYVSIFIMLYDRPTCWTCTRNHICKRKNILNIVGCDKKQDVFIRSHFINCRIRAENRDFPSALIVLWLCSVPLNSQPPSTSRKVRYQDVHEVSLQKFRHVNEKFQSNIYRWLISKRPWVVFANTKVIVGLNAIPSICLNPQRALSWFLFYGKLPLSKELNCFVWRQTFLISLFRCTKLLHRSQNLSDEV